MKAYKYFDAQLERAILQEGRFRLGTLEDYRAEEAHHAGIGDRTEGSASANSRVEAWTSEADLGDDHASEFEDDGGIIVGEGQSLVIGEGGELVIDDSGVRMINVDLRSETESENLYVFSVTLEPQLSAQQALGYDACYEIEDVGAFVRLLAAPDGAALIAQGPIRYQTRDLEFEAARAVNPALIKEPHFAYQREWRALWAPRAQPIAPVLVTSPEAARLCRRVALPG